MAYVHPTQTSTLGDKVRESWSLMLADLKKSRARRRLYRQTYAELAGLSDRDLADIGIPRAHIRAVAREHAYGL